TATSSRRDAQDRNAPKSKGCRVRRSYPCDNVTNTIDRIVKERRRLGVTTPRDEAPHPGFMAARSSPIAPPRS
ncbi:hypothetical protein, partial [Tautonia rosea]|uniref:hypothetical protein n=1 Tax=Tautonia rosea TaxID=2728037 RepID=UPI0019CFBD53